MVRPPLVASSPTQQMEGSVCGECKVNPWKYKCPGCMIRSCSLPCVKSHKQRTGCSGKRNVTEFVPLSQFDDNTLLSDYNMLEEVKRAAESAQRMRTKLCRYPSFRLPFYLRILRHAAGSRRTKILFLPSGMSKREKNQTHYNQRLSFGLISKMKIAYEFCRMMDLFHHCCGLTYVGFVGPWKKTIFWTIEWRFHSTDVTLIDHRVSENTSLCYVIENHLKPGPWKHKLKSFCDAELDSLKFFICKYPKGAKSPFKELDIKAPLRQQLATIVILEYPVIHVFLPSQNYDFEVIRDNKLMNMKPDPKDSLNNGDGTQKGVTFKEEEIEEDDITSFEPEVLDLIKQANLSPRQQVPEENKVDNRAPDNSNSLFDTTELGVSKDMELEFEQGLIDTYSDLFAEINPGDFFNFDGEFSKVWEIEEEGSLQNLAAVFPGDELEEGEIVE